MPCLIMFPIVILGIGDIEMAHEFLEVPQGGFDQQMEVGGQQYISQDFGLINIIGAFQKFKKPRPVGII